MQSEAEVEAVVQTAGEVGLDSYMSHVKLTLFYLMALN